MARVARMYRQGAGTVLGYLRALLEAPANLAEAERHIVAHLLHLLGPLWPRKGLLELANGWVWPDLGSVGASLAVDVKCRSERSRAVGTQLVAVLRGTARPLVHLAGRAEFDERWPRLPTAVFAQSAVAEGPDSSMAQRAVARVGEDEWRRGNRWACERQVERVGRPAWVEAAMVQRTMRTLRLSEGPGAEPRCVACAISCVGFRPHRQSQRLACSSNLRLSHRPHDRERLFLGMKCARTRLLVASIACLRACLPGCSTKSRPRMVTLLRWTGSAQPRRSLMSLA